LILYGLDTDIIISIPLQREKNKRGRKREGGRGERRDRKITI
jgi:hypothetical protein